MGEYKNTVLSGYSVNPVGVEGQIIFNTTDKKIKFYNGTEWVDA